MKIMKIEHVVPFHGGALFRKRGMVHAICCGTLEQDVKIVDKIRIVTEAWEKDAKVDGLELFWKIAQEAKKGTYVAMLVLNLPSLPVNGTIYAQTLEKTTTEN